MARNRPIWSRTGSLTTTPTAIALPPDWTEIRLALDARCYVKFGKDYAAPAVSGASGVITIRSLGSPSGGTWQARINPQDGSGALLTAAIAYNASAATIKTAFVNTGLFASGDITAAGGALPTDATLTFGGVWAGALPRVEIVNAVTGTNNPAISALITTLPSGNGGYGYGESGANVYASDLSDKDRFLYLAAVATTANYFVTALR